MSFTTINVQVQPGEDADPVRQAAAARGAGRGGEHAGAARAAAQVTTRRHPRAGAAGHLAQQPRARAGDGVAAAARRDPGQERHRRHGAAQGGASGIMVD